MQRQGTCNRCGQCCGPGGADPRSPWPRNWPSAIRNWQFADFEAIWPYLSMVGLEERPGGGVDMVEAYGNHNLQGKKIYWRWVPGHGLCKNLEPYDNPDTYALECPWLLPDPGDGTRPCAFVGSRFEDLWLQICGFEPPEEYPDDAVTEWQWRYPGCSYTWS